MGQQKISVRPGPPRTVPLQLGCSAKGEEQNLARGRPNGYSGSHHSVGLRTGIEFLGLAILYSVFSFLIYFVIVFTFWSLVSLLPQCPSVSLDACLQDKREIYRVSIGWLVYSALLIVPATHCLPLLLVTLVTGGHIFFLRESPSPSSLPISPAHRNVVGVSFPLSLPIPAGRKLSPSAVRVVALTVVEMLCCVGLEVISHFYWPSAYLVEYLLILGNVYIATELYSDHLGSKRRFSRVLIPLPFVLSICAGMVIVKLLLPLQLAVHSRNSQFLDLLYGSIALPCFSLGLLSLTRIQGTLFYQAGCVKIGDLSKNWFPEIFAVSFVLSLGQRVMALSHANSLTFLSGFVTVVSVLSVRLRDRFSLKCASLLGQGRWLGGGEEVTRRSSRLEGSGLQGADNSDSACPAKKKVGCVKQLVGSSQNAHGPGKPDRGQVEEEKKSSNRVTAMPEKGAAECEKRQQQEKNSDTNTACPKSALYQQPTSPLTGNNISRSSQDTKEDAMQSVWTDSTLAMILAAFGAIGAANAIDLVQLLERSSHCSYAQVDEARTLPDPEEGRIGVILLVGMQMTQQCLIHTAQMALLIFLLKRVQDVDFLSLWRHMEGRRLWPSLLFLVAATAPYFGAQCFRFLLRESGSSKLVGC